MLPAKSVTLTLLIAASLGLSGCIASADSPWYDDGCDDASAHDHEHEHDHSYEYEYEYEYDDGHGNHYEYDSDYEYAYSYTDGDQHEHDDADGCEDLTIHEEHEEHDSTHDQNAASGSADETTVEGHHDVWDGRAVGPTKFQQTIKTTADTELLVISADWTRMGTVNIYLKDSYGKSIARDTGSGYHHTDDDSWVLIENPGDATWTLTVQVYGYLDYHIEASY